MILNFLVMRLKEFQKYCAKKNQVIENIKMSKYSYYSYQNIYV